MAAHRNITTALPTGISLHADAEADDVQITETVEISELVEQDSGDIIKAAPVNRYDLELVISGEGPHAFTDVAVGTVADPTAYEEISVEVSEAPNQRCTFTLRATAVDGFTDPASAPDAAGAEPGITDLEITSVEYTIAESVRRTAEVEDHVLVGSDGTPTNRARETLKFSFDINGRGDSPAGVALGTGGVAYKTSDTGVTIVNRYMTGEKRKDWNRWGAVGMNYPAAS